MSSETEIHRKTPAAERMQLPESVSDDDSILNLVQVECVTNKCLSGFNCLLYLTTHTNDSQD